jgi:hypothetical protein
MGGYEKGGVRVMDLGRDTCLIGLEPKAYAGRKIFCGASRTVFSRVEPVV